MKVVVLANLRFEVRSPSWYRLLTGRFELVLGHDLHWYIVVDEDRWVPIPNRDTGAMAVAKYLNGQAAHGAS